MTRSSRLITRCCGWMILLASAAGTEICQAGDFDVELRITPEVPSAFQPITVHALQSPCFRFGLNLTAHQVVSGNVIRVVVPYNDVSCTPTPIESFQWTIPGVPAGAYRLELMADAPGAPAYFLLDAINIQVALGAVPQPQVVPSTTWLGLGTLALLFAMTGLWQWGRRR